MIIESLHWTSSMDYAIIFIDSNSSASQWSQLEPISCFSPDAVSSLMGAHFGPPLRRCLHWYRPGNFSGHALGSHFTVLAVSVASINIYSRFSIAQVGENFAFATAAPEFEAPFIDEITIEKFWKNSIWYSGTSRIYGENLDQLNSY